MPVYCEKGRVKETIQENRQAYELANLASQSNQAEKKAHKLHGAGKVFQRGTRLFGMIFLEVSCYNSDYTFWGVVMCIFRQHNMSPCVAAYLTTIVLCILNIDCLSLETYARCSLDNTAKFLNLWQLLGGLNHDEQRVPS